MQGSCSLVMVCTRPPGAKVRFDGSERTVIDGPFTESREVVAGYWIWECASREEAIEWLKRAPFGGGVEIELRQIFEAEDFGEQLTPELREANERLREQAAARARRVGTSTTHGAIDAVGESSRPADSRADSDRARRGGGRGSGPGTRSSPRSSSGLRRASLTSLGAWLMATAKRRGIDALRRRVRLEPKRELIGRELEILQQLDRPDLAARVEDVEDDVLRLIFMTCHPVLSRQARVALTLRLLGGLSTPEIARAFLVSEGTVAQRIVRASAPAEAHAPFERPGRDERAERLSAVLEVIYLVFNEGYAAQPASTGSVRRYARTRCASEGSSPRLCPASPRSTACWP